MKKYFLLILFLLFMMAPSVLLAQPAPLNHKQWTTIGEPGQALPNYTARNYCTLSGGENIITGNVCMNQYDANCFQVVTLGGGGGAIVDIAPMDGANILITANGMYVISGMYGWSTTSNQFVASRIIEASADAITLANSLSVLSGMYLWNGANWDRALNGPTGELLSTDVATRPGEDAGNDWRKIKKESIGTYSPAKEIVANIGAVATVVISSKEILGYPNCCFYLENDDAADNFTDADIQISPDNATWISLTWNDCDGLTPGAACSICLSGNAYRYARVLVTGAAGPSLSSVDGWITCNRG
jgi:hypothetical protein